MPGGLGRLEFGCESNCIWIAVAALLPRTRGSRWRFPVQPRGSADCTTTSSKLLLLSVYGFPRQLYRRSSSFLYYVHYYLVTMSRPGTPRFWQTGHDW